MNRKQELKILEQVYGKLREDCQDPQMGLSERYFEELCIEICKFCETKQEKPTPTG